MCVCVCVPEVGWESTGADREEASATGSYLAMSLLSYRQSVTV